MQRSATSINGSLEHDSGKIFQNFPFFGHFFEELSSVAGSRIISEEFDLPMPSKVIFDLSVNGQSLFDLVIFDFVLLHDHVT